MLFYGYLYTVSEIRTFQTYGPHLVQGSAQYNMKILFGQNGQPKSVLVSHFQI